MPEQAGDTAEGSLDADEIADIVLGCEDDEAAMSELFFKLLDDGVTRWTMPRGAAGFSTRLLGPDTGAGADDDDVGVDVLVVVLSSADHFEFGKTFDGISNVGTDDGQIRARISVLQVRDDGQAWYHRASEPDQLDPFGPVISVVVQEIERLGLRPKQLVTLGFCCGGYAAIRVGVSLGASRVVAFSPQAYLHPHERRERGLAPAYYDSTLESLREADACPLDSLAVALRHAAPRLEPLQRSVRVELHIGEDAPEDLQEIRAFMEELGMEALPNVSVSLHTYPECGHAVPYFLKNAGRLQEVLWRHLFAN